MKTKVKKFLTEFSSIEESGLFTSILKTLFGKKENAFKNIVVIEDEHVFLFALVYKLSQELEFNYHSFPSLSEYLKSPNES